MDRNDLLRARAALPALANCTYLNVGTYGILAQPVLERLLALTTEAEAQGTPGYERVGVEMEVARSRLAARLVCHVAELAFTENATHGLNLPLLGLPLQPGDDLLLSSEEYPITEHIARYLAQTKSVGVRFFAIAPDPEETLANVRAAWTPLTRLVYASMVTCETATRLPVAAICAFARERGAWSAVDVAQAVGTLPVDLHAIGCDYAIGNGHKWLHGPKIGGLFYARQHALANIALPLVSHYATRDPVSQQVTLPTDHQRFELVAAPMPTTPRCRRLSIGSNHSPGSVSGRTSGRCATIWCSRSRGTRPHSAVASKHRGWWRDGDIRHPRHYRRGHHRLYRYDVARASHLPAPIVDRQWYSPLGDLFYNDG